MEVSKLENVNKTTHTLKIIPVSSAQTKLCLILLSRNVWNAQRDTLLAKICIDVTKFLSIFIQVLSISKDKSQRQIQIGKLAQKMLLFGTAKNVWAVIPHHSLTLAQINVNNVKKGYFLIQKLNFVGTKHSTQTLKGKIFVVAQLLLIPI